ncbi:MAG TPA: molybdopterin molybdotransferase MoeA [Firmicutes bacterium]|nr:molybdopterin molybdotransferase MoeA [Bacillota bacterium]
MGEFLELISIKDAWDKLGEVLPWVKTGEGPGVRFPVEVPLLEAAGRILAMDLTSPEDVPSFDRSTVDGYAVRSRDTFGASDAMPALLRVKGEVRMGHPCDFSLGSEEAAFIPTGGMLPPGADAVVMVEDTDLLDRETVMVKAPVAPWENVVRRGEDIENGQRLLFKGQVLGPGHIGALAALGIREVYVSRRPRVAIVSSGDEVVDVLQVPGPGQVRDINSCALAAAVSRLGGVPMNLGIVPDDPVRLEETLERALMGADMVILSGGSSIGARDHAVAAISSLGKPGILVHGLSVKPGKPTVIAVAGDKPVFGLPGHPLSCLVIFSQVVQPLIGAWMGMGSVENPVGIRMASPWTGMKVSAIMGANIASAGGREDFISVRLVSREGELVAEPVLGKSAMISVLAFADGMVRVPPEREGIRKGDNVEVTLFGP